MYYGNNSRVNLENGLYGLLGTVEPYLLEYADGVNIELKGTKSGTVESELTEFKIFGWSHQNKTQGYQLFDKTQAQDNKYQQFNFDAGMISIVSASNYWITGFIEVEANKTYTINLDKPIGVYYNNNKEVITGNVIYEQKTFTTPSDAKYVVITFEKTNTPFDMKEQLMLNEGNTTKPYEDYTQGKQSPSTDYPQTIDGVGTLETLKVIVDGVEQEIDIKLYGMQVEETHDNITYADEYGQGWLADELDIINGKLIRRVSAEDETKEVQILEEQTEQSIETETILNMIIPESNSIVTNNSSANMEIVYKAYSGGV